MEILIQSFLLVFAGEMGDKTQILALILAARFRKPYTVMAGILVATLLNHAAAAYAGAWAVNFVPENLRLWILAGSFFFFAFWVLIPDKAGDDLPSNHYGAFFTTVVAFFLAEMGDKTQLATIALGARYSNLLLVTIGTTLGMLFANALAIFFGEKLLAKIPLQWIRRFASLLFFLFGILILVST